MVKPPYQYTVIEIIDIIIDGLRKEGEITTERSGMRSLEIWTYSRMRMIRLLNGGVL